jgi:hypothetical protein
MNLFESYHFRLWTGSLCQDGGNSELLLLPAGECGNICVWVFLPDTVWFPEPKVLNYLKHTFCGQEMPSCIKGPWSSPCSS